MQPGHERWRTPLYIAARRWVVTKLLAANADVNQAPNDGATPLYIACDKGHTEVVTKLLAANADVNQADNDGATPLFIACHNGHTEIVATLLAANADVNQAKNNGITPLYIACQTATPSSSPAARSPPCRRAARRWHCAARHATTATPPGSPQAATGRCPPPRGHAEVACARATWQARRRRCQAGGVATPLERAASLHNDGTRRGRLGSAAHVRPRVGRAVRGAAATNHFYPRRHARAHRLMHVLAGHQARAPSALGPWWRRRLKHADRFLLALLAPLKGVA